MKKLFLLFSLIFFSLSGHSTSTVHQFFQIFEGIDPGNENNATYAFKAATYKAIAGPHKFVIIDNPTSGPYTYNVTPLWFHSFNLEQDCQEINDILALHPFGDLTIDCSSNSDWENLKFIFHEDVTLEAIPCTFNGYDSMLGFNKISNFSIIGYGATLLGQYEEHAAMFAGNWPCETPPPPTGSANCYNPDQNDILNCYLGFSAQGRDGIHLMGCDNVSIEGINIVDMGSDGINLDPGLLENYSWDHDYPTKNVTIKNCSITNCGRVGICFCSAENASVSHTKFEHNGYLVTGFDIDVEPFHKDHSAKNISISKCSFNDAANGAITLGPNGLTDGSSEFSVDVEDCTISNTEIGFIQVGGKFTPKTNDKVFFQRNAMKKLGNDDALGNPPNFGILYRSRFDCEFDEKEFFWDVDNLVIKELNTASPNSFNSNSYGIQISGRTEIPIEYDRSCGEACVLLEECAHDSSREYFGGINIKNFVMYDEHAYDANGNNERNWQRLVVQEKAPYCREDGTILNSFKNIQTTNVVKVNPQNIEGVHAVMDDNGLDCNYGETCDLTGSVLKTEVFKPRAVAKLLSPKTITEGDILSFKICTAGRRVNTNPIAVDYTISGTADNQIDYDYLSGTTVIPVGARCRRCDIQTRIDCKNEPGGETIKLQIYQDEDNTYKLGKTTKFDVVLNDLHCGDFAPDNGDSEARNSETNSSLEEFSFYPNPTSAELNITHADLKNQTIQLLSRDGKILIEKETTGTETILDVTELSNGVYLIGIKNDKTQPNYKKCIISK